MTVAGEGAAAKRRSAGVLLHPTSLPGRFGIGDLGPGAVRFLDWARSAGFSVWQILPLGPTGPENSPYGALSVFAGNPLLISPEWLAEDGWLGEATLAEVPEFPEGPVDYERARMWKERLLRAAWDQARGGAGARAVRDELRAFLGAPERAGWLSEWTLYAAIKERQDGAAWHDWYAPVARRVPAAMEATERTVVVDREYHGFVQWIFARQWRRLHDAARERGIEIIGDMPIYPAPDSAEVWTRQDLFTLGEDGRPEEVAGVPPDYFSETGQLWGNPLYRWDRMEAEGFTWWIARVRAALETCDRLRIDHFRGFANYWAVPAGAETAVEGRWLPGPGMKLFEALRAALGTDLPIIAEDLGIIDEPVRELLRATGFPGMRVLQFGLLDPSSTHHPLHHPENCVVYTGTHDNDTARGWFEALELGERNRVLSEVGGNAGEIGWSMIRVALESPARLAIIPMQDVLGLGSDGRMNTPSEREGNWRWRMGEWALAGETAARARGLAERSARTQAAR
jgi:4-alpha-glucanotransferase